MIKTYLYSVDICESVIMHTISNSYVISLFSENELLYPIGKYYQVCYLEIFNKVLKYRNKISFSS